MQGGLPDRRAARIGGRGRGFPGRPVRVGPRPALRYGKPGYRSLAVRKLTILRVFPESFLGPAESPPGEAIPLACRAGNAAMRPMRERCRRPVEISVISLKSHDLVTISVRKGEREKMAFLAVYTGLSHHAVSRLQNRERPLVSRGFAVPRRTPPYLLTLASVTKTSVRRRASGAAGQGKIVTQGRFQVLRSQVVSLPRN
jgi:hypothetical protein